VRGCDAAMEVEAPVGLRLCTPGRWAAPEEMARELYAGLRALDGEGCTVILCSAAAGRRIGAAIRTGWEKQGIGIGSREQGSAENHLAGNHETKAYPIQPATSLRDAGSLTCYRLFPNSPFLFPNPGSLLPVPCSTVPRVAQTCTYI